MAILNRGEKSDALALLQERVQRTEKIEVLLNSTVKSMSRRTDGGLLLEVCAASGLSQIEADYLLIAVGREPSVSFISDELKNQLSHLQAEGRLYIVGDVAAGVFRQTSIATGDAVLAAMKIQKKLEDLS